jgi:hypothetical protein
MRVGKFGRATAVSMAGVLLIAGAAVAADLKVDADLSAGGTQTNRDLGDVDGGETGSFQMEVWFNGGPARITGATFSVDESPDFVTSVTSNTWTLIRTSGTTGESDNRATVTVNWEAPCELGQFGGNTPGEEGGAEPGAAVTFEVDDISTTDESKKAEDLAGFGVANAVVNIKGNVTDIDTAACSNGPDYDFDGFYHPVGGNSNDPADGFFITAKAGQGIALKWNLDADEVRIEDPEGYSASSYKYTTNCTLGNGVVSVEEAESSGKSDFRWDADAEQNIFVWKTSKNWGNSCRTFELSYDGTLVAELDVHFTK